jgi:hypothetical protein
VPYSGRLKVRSAPPALNTSGSAALRRKLVAARIAFRYPVSCSMMPSGSRQAISVLPSAEKVSVSVPPTVYEPK